MGAYVRFRLGGEKFPPSIYYKIFSKSPLCDVGAFAPKDYVFSRKCDKRGRRFQDDIERVETPGSIRVGSSIFNVSLEDSTRDEVFNQGISRWYARVENNGWRSIALQTLKEIEEDPVTKATNKLAIKFHFFKT